MNLSWGHSGEKLKTASESQPDQIVNGWGFLCRKGFEDVLRREIIQHPLLGKKAEFFPGCEFPGEGLVLIRGDSLSQSLAQTEEGLLEPLVFERQRLPRARFFSLGAPKALAASVAGWAAAGLRGAGAGWTIHSYAADPNGPKSLQGWAERMKDQVREALLAQTPALAASYGEEVLAPSPARGHKLQRRVLQGRALQCRVLQLCAVPGGMWVALSTLGELSNLNVGGVHQMRADPQAPSRSFLKIEEALQMMGLSPAPRERVIDLGAAPGGWSYAFLKRGCSVLSVDNGPLKLKGVENLAGELTHMRANGLTFRPPEGWTPVDWMVSDMLVPPGPSIGLLRRWLKGGWARRYIVNIKLPQRQPLAALGPLREMLEEQPGLVWQMRQLYHDRREVTLMGQVELQAQGRSVAERPTGKRSAGKNAVAERPTGKRSAGKNTAAKRPAGKRSVVVRSTDKNTAAKRPAGRARRVSRRASPRTSPRTSPTKGSP